MWSDEWIENLKPIEKLVWLYLLTNPQTNMLGVYQITAKRISFDIGVGEQDLRVILERFGCDRKCFFLLNSWIVLPNWIKNQSMNTNMTKSAVSIYNELPHSLLSKLSELGFSSFETLLNGIPEPSEPNFNGSEGFGEKQERFERVTSSELTLPNRAIPKIEIESEIEIEIPCDEKPKKLKPEKPKTWKTDFEVYKQSCLDAFEQLKLNKSWLAKQQKFNPNLNILLSIEKGINNFWGTEAGWKNKKKANPEEIDWPATFAKTIDLNKVYLPKDEPTIKKADF